MPNLSKIEADGPLIATFWSDSSDQASRLRNLLERRGFRIREIQSGSSEPVLEYAGRYFAGYTVIVGAFLMGRDASGP